MGGSSRYLPRSFEEQAFALDTVGLLGLAVLLNRTVELLSFTESLLLIKFYLSSCENLQWATICS